MTTQKTATAEYPPGPHSRIPGGLLWKIWKDPLNFLSDTARRYGDVASFVVGPRRIFLLSNPQDIRTVLIKDQERFIKSRSNEFMKACIGLNILTSEAKEHHRRRRLLQPAFHTDQLRQYGDAMRDEALRRHQAWEHLQKAECVVDIHHEMLELTLAIVGRTLLNVELGGEMHDAENALGQMVPFALTYALPFGKWMMRLPLARNRRFNRARRKLDAAVSELIRRHGPPAKNQGDLLTMLMQALDEDGNPMTADELLHEAQAIFVAGHETTANALTFALILLAQHQDIQTRLQSELSDVLQGRDATIDDIPHLRLTRAVFAESLRLYPPGWVLARRAVEDYPIRSYTMRKGSLVFMSPWVVHRDSRYFPEPERFHPERWLAEPMETVSRQAYFPFSAGVRGCIGEGFAWMEAVLVIATLAQRWAFQLQGDFKLSLDPFVVLRPGTKTVPMLLRRR